MTPSAPPAISSECVPDDILLRTPLPRDWPQIATLLAAALPNALVSHFGVRFGALYYRHFAESPGSFCRAAFSADGRLAGVVIGSRDRRQARHIPFLLLLRLLAAAHLRLCSPRFLVWLCAARRTTTPPQTADAERPRVELLEIAVSSDFRGRGMATTLLAAFEDFLRAAGEERPYLILTETANAAANAFYRRLGAHFAGSYLFHGRAINRWHKLPG